VDGAPVEEVGGHYLYADRQTDRGTANRRHGGRKTDDAD
jgi:hypothetical protein